LADRDKSEASADRALTVQELADRVGMTVRNLREWQTLGLLPRPDVRGRVGYYDPSVVERIEGIQRLHAEGFPLDLIRRMLHASGASGDEVMRFARALRAPFRESDAPVVDRDEWLTSWGAGPAELARAVELGLVRERPDGKLEFASSRVARVGETLGGLGLTAKQILDATGEIREHLDRIAQVFEQVWLDHIWEPFVDAGMPEDQLPALQATLAEVQPLATETVVGLFTVAMEATIEAGIAREVARAGAGRRARGA
jgi:DNA-binding transcriptional MerR regulator